MKTLKLKVVSDGSPTGTHLADAETGEPVVVEGAFARAEVTESGGHAVLVLPRLAVESHAAGAFRLVGAPLGHDAVGSAPAHVRALAAPAPAAPTGPEPTPEEQHREWNRRLNAHGPVPGSAPRA